MSAVCLAFIKKGFTREENNKHQRLIGQQFSLSTSLINHLIICFFIKKKNKRNWFTTFLLFFCCKLQLRAGIRHATSGRYHPVAGDVARRSIGTKFATHVRTNWAEDQHPSGSPRRARLRRVSGRLRREMPGRAAFARRGATWTFGAGRLPNQQLEQVQSAGAPGK